MLRDGPTIRGVSTSTVRRRAASRRREARRSSTAPASAPPVASRPRRRRASSHCGLPTPRSAAPHLRRSLPVTRRRGSRLAESVTGTTRARWRWSICRFTAWRSTGSRCTSSSVAGWLPPRSACGSCRAMHRSMRTLDALHLASCSYLRDRGLPVVMASYDRRVLDTARAMDMAVVDL